MNNGCPCQGCENRSITCHGECEKYIKWRDALDKLNEKNRANKDIASYQVDQIRKYSKQANHLRRKIHHEQ